MWVWLSEYGKANEPIIWTEGGFGVPLLKRSLWESKWSFEILLAIYKQWLGTTQQMASNTLTKTLKIFGQVSSVNTKNHSWGWPHESWLILRNDVITANCEESKMPLKKKKKRVLLCFNDYSLTPFVCSKTRITASLPLSTSQAALCIHVRPHSYDTGGEWLQWIISSETCLHRGEQRTDWELHITCRNNHHHLKRRISKSNEFVVDFQRNLWLLVPVFIKRKRKWMQQTPIDVCVYYLFIKMCCGKSWWP